MPHAGQRHGQWALGPRELLLRVYSGLPAHGAREAFWLAEFLEAAPWTRTRAMSFANSIACYVDHKGKVVCAGEPGQHMAGVRPPAPLQPERIDLIERAAPR